MRLPADQARQQAIALPAAMGDVAKSGDPDRAESRHGRHDSRHRIRDIEQQGCGAEPFHVPGQLHGHGDGAECSQHAAKSPAFPSLVVQSELLQDIKVHLPAKRSLRSSREDDEVRARQRLFPVVRLRDEEIDPVLPGKSPARSCHRGGRLQIQVHQHELSLHAMLDDAVFEDGRCKHEAASSDQNDFHPALLLWTASILAAPDKMPGLPQKSVLLYCREKIGRDGITIPAHRQAIVSQNGHSLRTQPPRIRGGSTRGGRFAPPISIPAG
ncbi:hypothetical protein BN871_EM_00110 [Paenibacillus sp. P22]|nr:hypothetical protein BN871_EM_00110 [Paenibacillus sp. P22]